MNPTNTNEKSIKQNKKLSLKEKMRLKKLQKKNKGQEDKNTNVQEFKPAQTQQKQQVNQMPGMSQMTEEQIEDIREFQEEIHRTYNLYIEKYRDAQQQKQVYDNRDLSQLKPQEKKDFMIASARFEAFQPVTSDRWQVFKKLFTREELQDIVFNNKLVSKYLIMQDIQQKVSMGLVESYSKWRNEYQDTCHLIDNILGLKDKEEENLEEILKKKLKKKEKQDINLIDEETLKNRAIEWTPEEIIEIELLKEQYAKSGLNFYNEEKEPMVLIYIGHVDSGKSTISGQTLLLSGKINELEVKRLKAEAEKQDRMSWWLAYLMDLNSEEREKGVTVEMGRATFETKKKRFTVLDCPGHKNYVQNMIEGAAQADVACLVVSARQGEFEAGFEKNGQTREHAMLARSLGAQNLIVCVNKMDTCDWSEERYNYIKEKLQEFLNRSCGFEHHRIQFCAIEGYTGENMKEKTEKKEADWYKDRTLFETFDSVPSVSRENRLILRIPILSKISLTGDIEVFGKIESGYVKPDMQCVMMPNCEKLSIVSIHNDDDEKMAYAGPGESIKLVVKGIDEQYIRRGNVICGTQYWANICQEFLAEVNVLDLPQGMLLTAGTTFNLHMHTIMVEAEIIALISKDDYSKNDGQCHTLKKPNFLKSQDVAEIVIKVPQVISLEKEEDFGGLGSFVMRIDTHTIGIGSVMKFKPYNKELIKNNYFFKGRN